jgi:hypothetical protein
LDAACAPLPAAISVAVPWHFPVDQDPTVNREMQHMSNGNDRATDDSPSTFFRPLDGVSFESGRCIYCGETRDLRKEHIFPYGLSGSAVIQRASCKACADITSAFEGKLQRGHLWPLRVFRDLRSRSKHDDAPATWAISVDRDGRTVELNLPVDDLPLLIHFPIFSQPRQLTGEASSKGISVSGAVSVAYGKPVPSFLKDHGATGLAVNAELLPADFARLITKIAYCYAFATGWIDRVEDPAPVARAILGTTDNIGDWVGTRHMTSPKSTGQLHTVVVGKLDGTNLLGAEVRLFSDSETPTYQVVLGALRGEPGAD